MKLYATFSFLLIILSSCSPIEKKAPERNDSSEFVKNQLRQNNLRIIQAVKTKSFNAIEVLYDKESLLFAEYNEPIRNKANIRTFYDEIFGRETIVAYHRETIETIILEQRVIEIGLFTKELENSEKLEGKYFNVWKIQDNGSMKFKAESFGYLHPIADPLKLVVSKASETILKPIEIPWEMEAYNALNETNVIDRVPERSAQAYTEDAKYLPFADSIKAGKPILLKHYQGYYENPAKIDSIQGVTYDYDLLEDGYIRYTGFYVDWSISGYSGNTTGTGISYWKRGKDNSLKIHRQIGLHVYEK